MDSPYRGNAQTGGTGVRQLRLVVVADDYEEAVAFFRDALGMPQQAAFQGDGDARVTILDAGRATLEIANPSQQRLIDEVEAGGRVSRRIRVALEVDDTAGTTMLLSGAGGRVVAEPVVTPWRSLNSRLEAPGDLQLTLFQELGPELETATDDEGSRSPASR
jgi:catechol 2,3-dioxygenase-like lactoylglutathione lyase family enzyme